MLLGSAPGPGAGERHIEDDSDRDTTRTGSTPIMGGSDAVCGCCVTGTAPARYWNIPAWVDEVRSCGCCRALSSFALR